MMRIAKENVDIKMEIPGAVIRQRTDLGDTTGLGKSVGSTSVSRQESILLRFFRVWRATCACAPTGVWSCVARASIPRPI